MLSSPLAGSVDAHLTNALLSLANPLLLLDLYAGALHLSSTSNKVSTWSTHGKSNFQIPRLSQE